MSEEKTSRVKMSDPWVKAVKPTDRTVDYTDSERRGLVLRVEPSGRKTWAVRYVFASVRRRVIIGVYDEVSLSKAREEAKKIRGAASLGTDTHADRNRLKLGETVKEVSGRWLTSEETRSWRQGSRAAFERYLKKRLWPAIGNMKMVQVTRAHIRGILDSIPGVPTRNRTLATARMFFAWAVSRDLLAVSPCHGIDMLQEAPRVRTYTHAEIRQILSAFGHTLIGNYVRLLFLLGVRRDELLGARWQDIDLDRGLWKIPAYMEKTGGTRRDERRVELSSAAVRVFKAQREQVFSQGRSALVYVFAGPDGQRLKRGAPDPHICIAKGRHRNGRAMSDHRLAKKRGPIVPPDFRLHDIRRTVSDLMLNELGISAYVVDVGILGHAKPLLLGTYMPSHPAKEIKAALEAWSVELERIERGVVIEAEAAR